MEDLISCGTIGLFKAIESYRPNKVTKPATFAARCIENEILMFLRSLKKTKEYVSVHDPVLQTYRALIGPLLLARYGIPSDNPLGLVLILF
ncbi:RNA polymerase sigma-28 factor precursor [compost metagenome]